MPGARSSLRAYTKAKRLDRPDMQSILVQIADL